MVGYLRWSLPLTARQYGELAYYPILSRVLVKQLTHIVRVKLRRSLIVLMSQSRGLRNCPDRK